MPELPEVETVRSGLESLLRGRIIDAVDQIWLPAFPADNDLIQSRLSGYHVSAVRRLGKGLLIDLDNDWCLVIHLKMTGQLVFVDPDKELHFGAGHPSDSLVDNLPDRSTRTVFHLGTARLYFNDQRKFGWIKLMPKNEAQSLPFFSSLGPDALTAQLDGSSFSALFKRKVGSPIKAALLDQTVIAGVGNIYADESLWAASIHPGRKVRDISQAEWNTLLVELRKILQLSIEQGGSSSRNYINAEGQRGAYLDFAAVYKRQGLPCRRCTNPIIKIRLAGRGTHLCPICQVEP